MNWLKREKILNSVWLKWIVFICASIILAPLIVGFVIVEVVLDTVLKMGGWEKIE